MEKSECESGKERERERNKKNYRMLCSGNQVLANILETIPFGSSIIINA
jgi:hypothetical protein